MSTPLSPSVKDDPLDIALSDCVSISAIAVAVIDSPGTSEFAPPAQNGNVNKRSVIVSSASVAGILIVDKVEVCQLDVRDIIGCSDKEGGIAPAVDI